MSQTLTFPKKRTRAKRVEWGDALIFELPIGEALASPIDPAIADCECSRLTPENLRRFFNEPGRLEEFERYLAQGFVGMCVHRDAQWISVMWMSLPGTRQPLHMPRAVAGTYWMFGTRTHDAYRSRGYAKIAFKALATLLESGAQGDRCFYADVDPANEASRRALLGFGFRPAGRMHTFSVPKLKLFWGAWRRRLPHPPLTTK